MNESVQMFTRHNGRSSIIMSIIALIIAKCTYFIVASVFARVCNIILDPIAPDSGCDEMSIIRVSDSDSDSVSEHETAVDSERETAVDSEHETPVDANFDRTCSKCSRMCASPRALKTHMRVHNEVKALFCDICGKRYIYQRCLKTHMKRIHQHCE